MAGRCGNHPEITEPRIHRQIRAHGILLRIKSSFSVIALFAKWSINIPIYVIIIEYCSLYHVVHDIINCISLVESPKVPLERLLTMILLINQ